EHLDPERTVVRELQRQVELESGLQLNEQQTRDLAGMFLFSGKDQEKEVAVLSGGEKARLTLASLLAASKNLLVLDEPTNHLDIPSAERLEQILRSPEKGGTYEGTLILISHDRALIDATCDHLLILDGSGSVKVFHGNYREWADHERRRATEAAETQTRKHAPKAATKPDPAPPKPKAKRKSRLSWMGDEQLEDKVSELEAQVAKLDATLDDPEIWTDAVRAGQLTDERAALKAELDEAEEEWLARLD
ncbi:MAG: ATP-binding cassette domain-containing protein, partial [Planctomycetota bacterium]